jgi:ankyrin repeat protein
MIMEKFLEESKNYDQVEIDVAFQSACLNGDVEKVKYLLTSPQLKFHPDIHMDKEFGLRAACMNGHLNVIKFLTTSPELKEHSDITYDNETPLSVASLNNHLNIVKFFLESPILKKYSKKINEQIAFVAACEKNNLDIVKYFIYERDIKPPTNNILTRSRIHSIKEIDKMFEQRALKKSLEKDLTPNNTKTSKLKL